MIVAPPGHLKTTALLILDRHYQNVQSYSMVNATTLNRLRMDLQAGSTRSLVFPELQSIYAGDPRVVSRVEHFVMQLVSEGNMGASWEDTRHNKFITRAAVFAAMPNSFYMKRAAEWEDSGFHRRFLWAHYALQDPDVLLRAIVKWERAKMGGVSVLPQIPIDGVIQDTATENERMELWSLLKYQRGPNEVRLVLLSKTLSVLRHHYQRIGAKKDAMNTMREFCRVFGEFAAELVVKDA
jgi:hypothetical protein